MIFKIVCIFLILNLKSLKVLMGHLRKLKCYMWDLNKPTSIKTKLIDTENNLVAARGRRVGGGE